MNSVGEVDPLGPFIGDSWAWVFGLCSYRAGWIPGSDSGPVLWLRPGTVLSREGAGLGDSYPTQISDLLIPLFTQPEFMEPVCLECSRQREQQERKYKGQRPCRGSTVVLSRNSQETSVAGPE